MLLPVAKDGQLTRRPGAAQAKSGGLLRCGLLFYNALFWAAATPTAASMSERIEISSRGLDRRQVDYVAGVLIRGGLIAYPTDSGYALGWRADNRKAQERVIRIRALNRSHHFTYCCRSLSDVGHLARVENWAHRLIRQVTPGPFTFILPASRQVPRWAQQNKDRTIGIRLPDHEFVQAILRAMDEPLPSSSLLLPDMGEEILDSEDLYDAVHGRVDLFVDAGYCPLEPTTLVDLSVNPPVVLRQGRGVITF
jgi:tRNA threonylcarbamoyl adenosine modification protein (Sua5/YciO/YrdC/YwlC family)